MPAYWLDSSVLIQAANDAYQFDVAPGFWDFFHTRIDEGDFCMPRQVEQELAERDDDVHAWVRDQLPDFVVEPGEQVQQLYGDIADFVNNGPFDPAHARGFLARADGWLIAHAQTVNGVVVTREVRAGEGARQVKIPNVCDEFRVQVINQSELLRRYGIRLVQG